MSSTGSTNPRPRKWPHMRFTIARANHGFSGEVTPSRERGADSVAVAQVGPVDRRGSGLRDRIDVGHLLREARSRMIEVDDVDLTHGALARAVHGLDARSQEGRCKPLEVLLRPLLRLVVMALSALDLQAEQRARRSARHVLWSLLVSQRPVHGPVDARGRAAVSVVRLRVSLRASRAVATRGGEKLRDDLVPRRVARQCVVEPATEGPGVDVTPANVVTHPHVVPVRGPVIGPAGRREQRLDGSRSLAGAAVLGEKRVDDFGRGIDRAGDVDPEPAGATVASSAGTVGATPASCQSTRRRASTSADVISGATTGRLAAATAGTLAWAALRGGRARSQPAMAASRLRPTDTRTARRTDIPYRGFDQRPRGTDARRPAA